MMKGKINQAAWSDKVASRPGVWWWLGQLLLTGMAGFFVYFGISLLVAAYGLGDPYSFIMTFFAASLMTMISLVMTMGFVLRMRRAMRNPPLSDDGGTTR